ncbi:hypothetical protein G7054_g2129 [Neopestalotiopsis clavispora]|nr:hypothetical protein G7054_g2129 [Neopestalotiopsis clavispora]
MSSTPSHITPKPENFRMRGAGALDPDDYVIAWFATSKVEAEAALDLLDERHEGLFPFSILDCSATLLAGRMCGLNIVIATGRGEPEDTREQGQESLLKLAKRIKGFFPNLLVGLVTGIVTPVPDLTQTLSPDIRLGDVLVGLLEGEKDERIAYHLSRETDEELPRPDRGFKRRITNKAVQEAICEIDLQSPNYTHKFFHYYGAMKTRKHKSGKYDDPGQNADISYRINADGIEESIRRAPRPSGRRTRVWHGPIQPGKYYATQDTRFWSRFEQAHTMETRLPVYVIRGVCDYGDGHDNEKWQPYASAMATAYAKTVLDKITLLEWEVLVTPTSGFERSDTGRGYNLRPRRLHREISSRLDSAYTSLHSNATGVEQQELASEPFKGVLKPSFLFTIFHRSTLMSVVLLFGLLGGVMMALAVNQTRNPVCNPTRDTLVTDDGFWTMLSQLSFLVLTVYCTLYPVILRSKRREALIDKFWFVILLFTSFATALAAVAAYPITWKAATILSCVSSLAQAVSTAQLANSLEPVTGNEYLPRSGTLELEELRSR